MGVYILLRMGDDGMKYDACRLAVSDTASFYLVYIHTEQKAL